MSVEVGFERLGRAACTSLAQQAGDLLRCSVCEGGRPNHERASWNGLSVFSCERVGVVGEISQQRADHCLAQLVTRAMQSSPTAEICQVPSSPIFRLTPLT